MANGNEEFSIAPKSQEMIPADLVEIRSMIHIVRGQPPGGAA